MPYIALDPTTAQAAPAVTFGQPETAAQHPAGKSLSSMRSRLVLELGNRTDLLVPVPSPLDEFINDAYIDFFGSMELPESNRSFLLTTVADQPFYLLPASVDTVRTISGYNADDQTTGAALSKIDTYKYRKLDDCTDEPHAWFREQNMIVLWPTPDDAYSVSVDCRIKPAKLAADTDYPALDDKWHEPLFKAAKYRAWEALQNDTKSLMAMNESARLVQRKTDRDAGDQEEAYPSVRVVRSRRDIMRLRDHRRGPDFHEFGDD